MGEGRWRIAFPHTIGMVCCALNPAATLPPPPQVMHAYLMQDGFFLYRFFVCFAIKTPTRGGPREPMAGSLYHFIL